MSPYNDPDALLVTLPYKHADGRLISADFYLPHIQRSSSSSQDQNPINLPALVYFHGGGLTVGTRESWFPTWLKDRLNSLGILFISADYRLIPPASGLDLVDDICDIFKFLSVDRSRIAVAGTSSGGLCAYLAALHAEPKPVAVLNMYAMGGDFLTPHYLAVKHTPFFRGREILDPSNFAEFLYPQCTSLESISESPLAYYPETAPIPGYPANPRMLLARLYLQLGVFLDYYTQMYQPSLSLALRGARDDAELSEILLSHLSPSHLRLFPQLQVSSAWPPTFLIHGEADTAVPVLESIHMRDVLKTAGVDVTLQIVKGLEHSFDYVKDAEAHFSALFDQAASFLMTRLSDGVPVAAPGTQ
ncbi:hypothetical protein EUX98_g6191 [Antrodiella citrinella]|uniref:Alpha/beta hydrolase fold-3 domain-containing protein n=1 Tax=Antrodiella citrinella TaxID=2447956 RepID=A0A4S4MPL0_9APHY|nr:hypothetical protein EUX98_g6191 [Antrodiella citrinella]